MCAQIAGLQDFRGAGPPGDIGVFQGTASVVVYQFTFSGVTYIVAQRMGVRGWILVCPPNIDAATVIQAAINQIKSDGIGGSIYIHGGAYYISAPITVTGGLTIEGVFSHDNWGTRLICTGDTNLLEYTGVDKTTFILIRNLKLIGSGGAAGTGLYFSSTMVYDLRLENIFVTNFTEQGAYIGNAWGVNIYGCLFEANVGHGLVLAAGPAGKVYGGTITTNNKHGCICNAGNTEFIGVTFNNNKYSGLQLTHDYVVVNACDFQGNDRLATNTYYEIEVSSRYNSIIGNTINSYSKTKNSIYIAAAKDHNVISSNVMRAFLAAGVYGDNDTNSIITNNIILSPTGTYGIHLYGADRNVISNNKINSGAYGIYLSGATASACRDNLIHGNYIGGSTSGGIYVNAYFSQITDNVLYGITGYGVDVSVNSFWNTIKHNKFNIISIAPVRDLGQFTLLESKIFQFTEAIAGAISVVSPTGIDVDAIAESALVWGQVPNDVQQVVRIKVQAVATGAPIGAGGQMHLAATFNAGAANEAYNTAAKSWTLADFDGKDTDYVADDVVRWVIVDANVANKLLALAADDSFEFFATYNVGANPDGATDAVLRCIEIEYV